MDSSQGYELLPTGQVLIKERAGEVSPPGPPIRGRRFISQQMIAALQEVDTQTGKAKVRLMCEKLIDLAVGGDISAIREVTDRAEGKAVQAVQLSGPGGGPIESIVASMTPQEAAALYANTLGGDPDPGSEVVEFQPQGNSEAA